MPGRIARISTLQVTTMNSIRSVNICWEKRFRGSYPASRFSLSDAGSLVIAVPRPLESRTYDVTRLNCDGSIEIENSFSVETLVRLEINNTGARAIGMTADDLYLFTGGSKNKFLAERRLSYIDAMVSEGGERIAAGFSDLNGTSFAIAYGEMGGKASWTRDVNTPLTAIAISRDGTRITIGTELGIMWQIDAARRDSWEFEQMEPIRALASSKDGSKVVYGTASGNVGCLDAEGARIWETHLPGEIVHLALSGDGSICTAVCLAVGELPGRIICLYGMGSIGWEYEPEKLVKGLSLSSSGRYLATGTRDGLQTVFEIVLGEGGTAGTDSAARVFEALESSRQKEKEGDLEQAFSTLLQALNTCPTSSELALEASELRKRRVESGFHDVQNFLDQADYTSAIEVLSRLGKSDPANPAILNRMHELVIRGTSAKIAEAKELELNGQLDAADFALLQAIGWDPFLTEPRDLLSALRSQRAAQEAAIAAKLLEDGKIAEAVAAYERASSLDGSSEISANLENAKTLLEFDLGMEHYNDKRYREAMFQFKKVLLHDPAHAEAARYLGYAQKFVQDTSGESLNDRFSRLE